MEVCLISTWRSNACSIANESWNSRIMFRKYLLPGEKSMSSRSPRGDSVWLLNDGQDVSRRNDFARCMDSYIAINGPSISTWRLGVGDNGSWSKRDR